MKLSDNCKTKLLILFFLVICLILIDQFTKKFLLFDIGLNNSKPFIPGIVQFTLVQNTGGAFSTLKQYPIVFQIFGIVNALLFSYLTFCPTVQFNNLTKTGCAFVLGGTLGNLIDRLIHGGVIDFFDLQFINFAVFNMADIFIDLGVLLIIVGWLCRKK